MAYGVAGAAPVVGVDVADGVAAAVPVRPAAENGRQSGPLDQSGQRVVDVQGEHQGAVDVAAGQVAADARVVVAVLGEQQHQLVVVGGQLLADAAQLPGEEGVGEDPGLGFGHDDGHGVVAPGDQAAGGLVGDVAEFVHRAPDPLGQGFADPVEAVDHAGHRGPGDPCPCGHGLQRRSWRCLAHFGAPPCGWPKG